MRQLSGLDASFLHMEDDRVTGHVGGLIVLDPTTAEREIDADAIRQHIAERLAVLPPLRWKLVEVPFGFDRPYWIDDHDVDLDFHVRGIALPKPGSKQQLIDQVNRLHARRLDRSHPLWEFYVIEGLEGGKVAIFMKCHHAAIDGKAAMQILSTLMSQEPNALPPSPPENMPPSETRPTDIEMFTRGWLGVMTHPGRAMALIARIAVEWQTALGRFGYEGVSELTAAITDRAQRPAPRLVFNRSMTTRRTWAFGSIPLHVVKEIKDKQDRTINDVVMALCAGGIRRWLTDTGELPDVPIRAMVPVSIRPAERSASAGNQVSALVADLPTDLADPRARLEAVSATMRKAKEEFAMLPATTLQEFSQFAAPAAAELVARTAASARLADHLALPFNLTISNVPGPREKLYFAGARMEANYPVPMIGDGMCLNITIHSYRDSLDFGLMSCPELIADIDVILRYITEELDVLKAL